IKEMADMTSEAAEAVAQDVRGAVAEAVKAWAETHAEAARKQVVSGQLPQAEELYLRMLALGSDGGQEMSRFFDDRYGRSVGGATPAGQAGEGQEQKSPSPPATAPDQGERKPVSVKPK